VALRRQLQAGEGGGLLSSTRTSCTSVASRVELPDNRKAAVTEHRKFENNWAVTDVRLVNMQTSTIIDVSNGFKDHTDEILAAPTARTASSEVAPEDSVSNASANTDGSSKSDGKAVRTPDAGSVGGGAGQATPAKFRNVLRGTGSITPASPPPGTGLAAAAAKPSA